MSRNFLFAECFYLRCSHFDGTLQLANSAEMLCTYDYAMQINLKLNFIWAYMIKNLTKKRKLEINAIICSGIFAQSIGLMFSKKQEIILIFKFSYEKLVPLHMLFVFYPIDVLFLNDKRIVVELKENFKPFAFYYPKEKAKYVVEMPEGSIKKLKAEVGDRIRF